MGAPLSQSETVIAVIPYFWLYPFEKRRDFGPLQESEVLVCDERNYICSYNGAAENGPRTRRCMRDRQIFTTSATLTKKDRLEEN